MSINISSRKELDGKLTGYEHPQEPVSYRNPNSNHVYKTINVKDRNAVYESSTKKSDPYSKYGNMIEKPSKKSNRF